MRNLIFTLLVFNFDHGVCAQDYQRALRRAQYLLNSTIPSDAELQTSGASSANYRAAVRRFIENKNFYDATLRYHERVLGVGLPTDYLEELLRTDIDNKSQKFTRISCNRDNGRFRCTWMAGSRESSEAGCSLSQEQAVSVFWYPQVRAWVCPTIVRACGPDLSRCFIEYGDKNEAKNTELGTSEGYDSVYSVIKSLSRQAAGIATAVAFENYPYTKILEPGLTAVDGAVANFYRQTYNFRIGDLQLPQRLLDIVNSLTLTDTRFRLVFTGASNQSGGILSSFGYLRRYEKNRTRANQLYERLLCRKFSSELPRVFPQDPGNLRTTPGCSGCHATLDPLADFFKSWGEGGNLYQGQGTAVSTYFNGHNGMYLSDLANIIRTDNAFATCTVENVWKWTMGRSFYFDESEMRAQLTNYFVKTNYSFRELVFAVVTHPLFASTARSDGEVTDPLEEPPLGQPPGVVERTCPPTIDYATEIAPKIQSNCGSCHYSGNPQNLTNLTDQTALLGAAATAAGLMASGSMPPGQSGPPAAGAIFDLKELVRCWGGG